MKYHKLLSLFLILFSFQLMAQKEVKEISIHVDGVCGMCKTRIENALDVKGVKMAEWTAANHTCKVAYRTDKITEEEIHQLLNAVGHDTETSKASDEEYLQVHTCCKYREMTTH